MNFLGVIGFRPARIPGDMDMADQARMRLDPADQVAVHDLNMVAIKEQFHGWRPDAIHNLGAIVDMVALVAGVPLHGVVFDAGIQHFKAQGHPVRCSKVGQWRETLDASISSGFPVDQRTLGIVRILAVIAGKAYDIGEAELGGEEDSLPGNCRQTIPIVGIVESSKKRRLTAGINLAHRAGKPVFGQDGIILRGNQLDRRATQIECRAADALGIPASAKILAAPMNQSGLHLSKKAR